MAQKNITALTLPAGTELALCPGFSTRVDVCATTSKDRQKCTDGGLSWRHMRADFRGGVLDGLIAAVDSFCSALSGPQYSAGLLSPAVLEAWAGSTDPYVRRASLATVATAFQRAALRVQSPVPSSLRICELLVDDRHDHVVKALSWALRNLASRDREAVGQFVQTHEGRLPARVLREVRTKLLTGQKNKKKVR